MSKFDLIVIGTGAGGLTVASEARKKGMSVALVGNDRPGGDCSYYGCVPTKTLVHSAKVLDYIRRAHEYGLPRIDVQPDFASIMAHQRRIVDEMTAEGSWEPWEEQGFAIYRGEGRLVSQHEVQVNGDTLQGEKLVLAVGTEPAVPPIEGLREVGCITNVEAVALEKLPARLLVLGAGPIGMEFSQIFARLGSRVTVLEMAGQVLPREDTEVAAMLRQYLEDEGIEIHTSTKVIRVEKTGNAKTVTSASGGSERRFEVDEILAATGRKAPLDGLGLEDAGVKTRNGWIVVDDTMRTTVVNIWAVGDCTGKLLFTHVGDYQARIAAHNLFAAENDFKKADYTVVPWVTFTDPELARVGLTEAEARDKGLSVQTASYRFSEAERARLMLEQKGIVKVVAGEDRRILGATILGPHADDLIHELALAIKAGLTTSDVLSMIHAYPTLSEAVRWCMLGFEDEGSTGV
jgi:pyruvate/2-oxoglutarate dehydrogenase complex dihydrolipoamide dehydrogenase (E3) component